MSSPLQTPLYALHQQLGGKLVDFAGYALPLSYAGGGLLAEHLHTREGASLFDVSHMGQLTVRRSSAAARALSSLMPADADKIAAGAAKYTQLTNAAGGVIDDCIVTSDGDDGWFIVINASRKAADIPHLRAALQSAGCADALTEHNDAALLAVQGPAAATIVSDIFPDAANLRFMQSARLHHAQFGDCRLSRCGYTGEDGFEISVAAACAEALARHLLAQPQCKPAGLGARDSLRIEAGLCLYGNELSETISPIEAGLLWSIPKARRGADGGYAGADVIAAQIANGAPRRLTGILPQSKTPARAGAKLAYDGAVVGVVTSGVYSPTLKAPAALGFVSSSIPADADLSIEVRGQQIACRQSKLPLVSHRYLRG